jgi:hypothetical protein
MNIQLKNFEFSEVNRVGHTYIGPLGYSSLDGGDDEDDECARYYKNIKDGKTNRRHSGTGILEFSPLKAGLDVTPANYDFSSSSKTERTRSGTLNSLSGKTIKFLKQYNII